ncbi:hypothetical protein [Crocosphaera sp.]|uniref:hypothetical protein n=1 Tax=Crocosphaera sp. TaxID=2729996 RepID=UPI00262BDA70|nr:hypothetical protein [Crocosphaera sp.]MDJ0579073.1 hypothetical protein [Crocosphaera sp.]
MLTKKHAIFNTENEHDAEIIAELARNAEEQCLEKARESVLQQVKQWLEFRGYQATDELAGQFLTGRI